MSTFLLWIFIGRTDDEDESPILWLPDVNSQHIGKDFGARKDWRQEEMGTTEDKMVVWHHWLNGHEFEQAPRDGEGQESLACCSPKGLKESDTTERLHNSNNIPLTYSPAYHQLITLPSTWKKTKTITQELLVSPWPEPQTYQCCYYSFLLFWYKMKHPFVPCFRFHTLSLYLKVSLWVIHFLLHHQLLLLSKIDLISIPLHTKYRNVCLS